MCQVLRSQLGLFDCGVDLRAERVKGALERGRNSLERGERCGQTGAQQATVGSREEQGDAEAEVGDTIAEAIGQAFNEAVQAQSTQLVGDGALGDRRWIAP